LPFVARIHRLRQPNCASFFFPVQSAFSTIVLVFECLHSCSSRPQRLTRRPRCCDPLPPTPHLILVPDLSSFPPPFFGLIRHLNDRVFFSCSFFLPLVFLIRPDSSSTAPLPVPVSISLCSHFFSRLHHLCHSPLIDNPHPPLRLFPPPTVLQESHSRLSQHPLLLRSDADSTLTPRHTSTYYGTVSCCPANSE